MLLKVDRKIGWFLVCGAIVFALVAVFQSSYRPWQRTWGARQEEVLREMPGDEIVSDPAFDATRAVEIAARPEEIWPWIVQIGYRRAGFYSYDWLDNDRIASAEAILPQFQALGSGDTIPLSRSASARVEILEPNEHMLMVVGVESAEQETWTWAWGLYPEGPRTTRLVTRLRVETENQLSVLLLDAFEIVMMRKCLLGIKRRVETATEGSPG